MRKLNPFASVSLLLAMIFGGAELRAAEKEAVVKGTVLVDEPVPAPGKFKLEDEMRRLTGEEHYVEETWLVGENKGLANCLVTLRAKNPTDRIVPKPAPVSVITSSANSASARMNLRPTTKNNWKKFLRSFRN